MTTGAAEQGIQSVQSASGEAGARCPWAGLTGFVAAFAYAIALCWPASTTLQHAAGIAGAVGLAWCAGLAAYRAGADASRRSRPVLERRTVRLAFVVAAAGACVTVVVAVVAPATSVGPPPAVLVLAATGVVTWAVLRPPALTAALAAGLAMTLVTAAAGLPGFGPEPSPIAEVMGPLATAATALLLAASARQAFRGAGAFVGTVFLVQALLKALELARSLSRAG